MEIMKTWFSNNYRCINPEEFYKNEDYYLGNWNTGWEIYEDLEIFWNVVKNELIEQLAGELTGNCPSWVRRNRAIIYTIPKKIIFPENRILTDAAGIQDSIPRLIEYLKSNLNDIFRIDPRDFEKVVAEIFRKKGFNVNLTSRSNDGGKDVIALSKDALGIETKYFIECKRYSLENKVGVDIIRSLYGVHHTVNSPNVSVLATTSTFTRGAKSFVEKEIKNKLDISLKDFEDISRWVKGY